MGDRNIQPVGAGIAQARGGQDRLGIAGLGTVGAALIRVLAEKHNFLSHRCGRSIEGRADTDGESCLRPPKAQRA